MSVGKLDVEPLPRCDSVRRAQHVPASVPDEGEAAFQDTLIAERGQHLRLTGQRAPPPGQRAEERLRVAQPQIGEAFAAPVETMREWTRRQPSRKALEAGAACRRVA